ncbi:threonine dehydrogenase-like Zn-dependent dehydrogenase [Salinibacter ruber]|uniref:zinc-dependent alcohol dehydrogenase family protein n=1 Tax=Salinibacter ruber TaxID=146919 RepID=UPI002167099D|nr:zinc-dependent alcohol dehydrogenase family protein [Salinibacter ruber]MCS3938825.1 threonine dehydrogenase-like Zn-dependent dehydrogenase [Salinibacter ruber]
MRAAVFHEPGDIRVEDVPDPSIEAPTDAILRITRTAICGSDLWFYRGHRDYEAGWRTGHEPMGVVEDVGSEVRSLEPGDRVLAPFAISDGTCEFCRQGLHTSCVHGNVWAAEHDGAQGEAVRAPQADGTLVKIPERAEGDASLLRALFPLTDVMGTGHHAAVSAGVEAGSTCVVVGDGAVGLCAVLAAQRLGAERIIAMGHHEERLEKARGFGATDIVSSRGEEAVEAVREMTRGGARHVMECVGAASAIETAISVCRPGGTIGYVGVPFGAEDGGLDMFRLFRENITLQGGIAPVRAYIPELMDDVLDGTLDPSPVFDKTIGLEEVPDGYAAMDERESIKVMVEL